MEPKDIKMALSPYIFNPETECCVNGSKPSKQPVWFITGYLTDNPKEIKPVLYHLSDLKDEHAIEVCKIEYGIFRDADVDFQVVQSRKNKQVVVHKDGKHWHTFELTFGHFHLDAIQYLQKEGYALPYMGNCLFENGIAIRKEVK